MQSRFTRDECIKAWASRLTEQPQEFIKIMTKICAEEYSKGYSDGMKAIKDEYVSALLKIEKMKAKLKSKRGKNGRGTSTNK